jgi:hypothetical protein
MRHRARGEAVRSRPRGDLADRGQRRTAEDGDLARVLQGDPDVAARRRSAWPGVPASVTVSSTANAAALSWRGLLRTDPRQLSVWPHEMPA